jgi:hypothetical protein
MMGRKTMQVTIRHRQETAGLAGNKCRFYVDCDVRFSEEEKAIIRERGLGERAITLPPAFPQGSGVDPDSVRSSLLRFASRGCVVFGLITTAVGEAMKFGAGLGVLIMLGGFGIFVFRKSAEGRNETSYSDQTISLARLVANPVVTVYAGDLNEAEFVDGKIRSELSYLKGFLTGNTRVKEVETFEL